LHGSFLQASLPLLPIILPSTLSFIAVLGLGLWLIRRFRSTLFPSSYLIGNESAEEDEVVDDPRPSLLDSLRKGGRRQIPILGVRTSSGSTGERRSWVIDEGFDDEESKEGSFQVSRIDS
jgi:hypothetical protein